MKKIIFILLAVAPGALAQTNPIPDLPVGVDTYTDEQVFFAGMTMGFVVGASGFLVRFLRQPAKQNPEI